MGCNLECFANRMKRYCYYEKIEKNKARNNEWRTIHNDVSKVPLNLIIMTYTEKKNCSEENRMHWKQIMSRSEPKKMNGMRSREPIVEWYLSLKWITDVIELVCIPGNKIKRYRRLFILLRFFVIFFKKRKNVGRRDF